MAFQINIFAKKDNMVQWYGTEHTILNRPPSITLFGGKRVGSYSGNNRFYETISCSLRCPTAPTSSESDLGRRESIDLHSYSRDIDIAGSGFR